MLPSSEEFQPDRFTVILCRPDSPENIGLAARAMKNTGFSRLRLVMDKPLRTGAYITAVHSQDILDRAERFSSLSEAVFDLDAVFAAAARPRKNFPSLTLSGFIPKLKSFSPESRIGLLFGNERTGLSSQELRHSNFRIALPQASDQPSYNLAAAVLLLLFHLFFHKEEASGSFNQPKPVSRRRQEECIERILKKLEEKDFIHSGNKSHITSRMYDLFGRLAMSESDCRLLLAAIGSI